MMIQFSRHLKFKTKSKVLVQLFASDKGVVAKMDDIKVGFVRESKEFGFSLKAQHSVKVKDKYIHYTIVPEKKDVKRICRFFSNTQKLINNHQKKQSDEMLENILKRCASNG